MVDIFSDEIRRNPYPAYDQLRSASPLLRVPPPFNAWMVFDYDSARRVLTDHETFSSTGPFPRNWFIFYDPPRHTRLRALVSRAFTPRMIAGLETRIRELSRELLDKLITRPASISPPIFPCLCHDGYRRHDRYRSRPLAPLPELERYHSPPPLHPPRG